MGNEKLNKLLIGLALLIICFALDRLTKIYILDILIDSEEIPPMKTRLDILKEAKYGVELAQST